MTLREASNARSSTGAKSTLNPSARQFVADDLPMLAETMARSPVANTSAADGAAPSASRKRSTVPPSRSTQVKSGVATHFWHSRSSRHVCSGLLIFRANRITPAGCRRVSREPSASSSPCPRNRRLRVGRDPFPHELRRRHPRPHYWSSRSPKASNSSTELATSPRSVGSSIVYGSCTTGA